MNDGDVMVYLRNATLALLKIAKEKGIRISITATPKEDGFAYADAGEYCFTHFDDYGDDFEYRKRDDTSAWRTITPEQVDFSGEPKKAPAVAAAGGQNKNILQP